MLLSCSCYVGLCESVILLILLLGHVFRVEIFSNQTECSYAQAHSQFVWSGCKGSEGKGAVGILKCFPWVYRLDNNEVISNFDHVKLKENKI